MNLKFTPPTVFSILLHTHQSVHPSYSNCLGVRGRGHPVDRLPLHHRPIRTCSRTCGFYKGFFFPQIQIAQNWLFFINLRGTSLACGRKPDYLDRTHTDRRWTCGRSKKKSIGSSGKLKLTGRCNDRAKYGCFPLWEVWLDKDLRIAAVGDLSTVNS